MNWLSTIGSVGASYIWYWVAAVITAVGLYVGVINVDNVRLQGIVYTYAEKSKAYHVHLADSIAAEELRHEFVEHVNSVMTMKHDHVERSKNETHIREHFELTNQLFNMGVADISEGSHAD